MPKKNTKWAPVPATLRWYRQAKRKKIIEMAEDIEVDRTSITMWEKGHTVPSEESMFKMSDYFGVPVEALCEEIGIEARDVIIDNLSVEAQKLTETDDDDEKIMLGLKIAKYLYPQVTQIDAKVEISKAEEDDDGLLEEGDAPEAYSEKE